MTTKLCNKSCCISGCSQATRVWMKATIGNISFHGFPRQKENQQKWISSIQRHNGVGWVPKKDSRVCSIHFGDYCWEKTREDGKRKLKWGAVPLHVKPSPIQPHTPRKEHFAFDHPYCSGVFRKKASLSDITNKTSSNEHSYSTEQGRDWSQHITSVNNKIPAVPLPTVQDTENSPPMRSELRTTYSARTPSNTQRKRREGRDGFKIIGRCKDTPDLSGDSPSKIPRKGNPAPMDSVSAAKPMFSMNSSQLGDSLATENCVSVSANSAYFTSTPMRDTSVFSPPAPMDRVSAAETLLALNYSQVTDTTSASEEINPFGFSSTPTHITSLDSPLTSLDSVPIAEPEFSLNPSQLDGSPATDICVATSSSSFPCSESRPSSANSTEPAAVQPCLADLKKINKDLRNRVLSNQLAQKLKDKELAATKEENRRLKEQLKNLSNVASKINKQNVVLRQTNRVITRRNVALTKRQTNLESGLSSVFHSDQLEAISRKSTRGLKWQPETIKSALVLKMQCGTSGYEELGKKLPYPSARTFQRQVQHIVFASGILDEVFDMILVAIRNMSEKELDCVLAMDEMSIDPGERIDPSTNAPIGRVTLNTHQGIANKALVFILGGISTRWKQTIAYFFTRCRKDEETPDAVGKEISDIIRDIIRRAEAVGLRVHCVISDMGPENRAVWRQFGIECYHNHCKFSIPHPVRPHDSLCFVPDVPHVFKSLKKMLLSNKVIFLPADIVEEGNLPTNVVDARHLKDLVDAESKFELKIAPRLRDETLNPKHFQTMKVGNARAVINHKTSTGLQVLALEKQDPSYLTTAWFVSQVNKWFELMTSRCFQLALSKTNIEKYEQAIAHLEKIVRIFGGMRVGQAGHWKPVQTGVILATRSILYMQDYLLNTRGFRFVLTSRFSQDFLENLFSSVRARQSIPHGLAFKNILKVVTIAQYCRRASGSSYDFDEGDFLLDFLSVTKSKRAERLAAASTQPSIAVTGIPRATDADIDNYFPLWERLVIYDMCGAALASVKKNFSICDVCFNACLHHEEQPYSYSVLVQLNSFAPGALLEVSDVCYKVAAKAELVFRSTREVLMKTTNVDVQDLLVQSLKEYVWSGSSIPPCHDIQTKLLRRFLDIRWKIFGLRRTLEERGASKYVYGSKSMAMHTIVQ